MGYDFNQSIILPSSLTSLIMGVDFNQSIILPPSLTSLKLGNIYTNNINNNETIKSTK